MASALSRWIDLREGEARAAILAMLTLLGLVAGHTMLETARDALFLGRLPPGRLPLVYTALAAIALVVMRANASFVRRFGRRNALIITLMLAAYGTTMLYLAPVRTETVFALYLWSGTLSMVMVAQFWMLTGATFTVTQGKRLFGPIGAGGVIGAVIGASIAAFVLEMVDVRKLLPSAAAVFLATAGLLTELPNDAVARTDRVVPTAPKAEDRGGLALLWRDPYLRRITLQAIVLAAAVLVADYLFKSQVARTVPKEQLGSYLARYYAVLNAASLIVQLFVAGAVVRRLGVIGATVVLPMALLGGAAGVFATGGALILVLLTKGADGALRHSLNRVTTELTWLPLPDSVRSGAKAVVDTSVNRVVQASTAAVIFGLALMQYDTPKVLSAMLIVLTIGSLMISMSLRAPYLDLFRKALGRNEIRADEFHLDLNSAEITLEALSSREVERVLAAIDLLLEQKRSRLIPALILYHESPEVLQRALAAIATPDRKDWIPLGERLLDHADERVRVAAIFALVGIGRVDAVATRMNDVSPAVRAQTAFVLAEREMEIAPSRDARIGAVMDMPGVAGRQARLGLLEAIRTRGDERWSPVLLRMAEDDDESMHEPLARAMEHVKDPRFLPVIIANLDSRSARGDFRSALIAYGPAGLAALSAALKDPETPERVRPHIPRAISAFANQDAADLLIYTLANDKNGSVRFRALRGLVSLLEDVAVKIDRNVVSVELRRNLIEYFRLMALAAPLAVKSSPVMRQEASRGLLVALLEDKRDQALSRVFLVLQVLHRGENLRRVQDALKSSDPRARANASEFLDNLTLRYPAFGKASEEARSLLVVLADDLPTADRLNRAKGSLAASLPTWPTDADTALGILIRERDAGIATIAAEYALSAGSGRLMGEVQMLSKENRFLDSFFVEAPPHAV